MKTMDSVGEWQIWDENGHWFTNRWDKVWVCALWAENGRLLRYWDKGDVKLGGARLCNELSFQRCMGLKSVKTL